MRDPIHVRSGRLVLTDDTGRAHVFDYQDGAFAHRRWTDPDSGITVTAHDEAGARFLAGLVADHGDHRAREALWHDDLRRRGVTLAHPDDGWVDRRENSVHFAYPRIRVEPPRVGALVALGTPERWRIVRLTRFEPWLVGLGANDGRWFFEEVRDGE